MRRVHRQRRQDREYVGIEIFLKLGPLLAGQFAGLKHKDALLGHFGLQFAPLVQLGGDQTQRGGLNLGNLLGWGHSVLAGLGHARAHLLAQARIAHHVELIEIARRDRQEPETLQQRMGRVVGLVQNTLVELKPGKLPVQKSLRRRHKLSDCALLPIRHRSPLLRRPAFSPRPHCLRRLHPNLQAPRGQVPAPAPFRPCSLPR